jgi:hypothetical protein
VGIFKKMRRLSSAVGSPFFMTSSRAFAGVFSDEIEKGRGQGGMRTIRVKIPFLKKNPWRAVVVIDPEYGTNAAAIDGDTHREQAPHREGA